MSIPRPSRRRATARLRPMLLPILQTAAAAVAAYYVAVLLPLNDPQPVFASIAAVICLGASYSRRGRRAAELVAGVVLGLTVADLMLGVIGTGPLQIGAMVVLAMGTAVLLGGGELFVVEAAVSTLIIVSLHSTGAQFSLDRPIEALVGGAVALAIGSFVLPPDPALIAGRAAQRVFGDLGGMLGQLADALEAGDADDAARALQTARATDGHVAELQDTIATARETARLAPARRSGRDAVERYARTLPHVDHAVRNARVLARNGLRYARSGLPAPEGLVLAVRELADAVWSLAAAYDDPVRSAEAHGRAVHAATRAREAFEREPDLALTEIVGGVRSTAVDLARAADLAGDAEQPVPEVPTEELLAPTAVAEPLL
jgi:uncharacterized membrane protein YgaE (UPF0421/DUF939 family)